MISCCFNLLCCCTDSSAPTIFEGDASGATDISSGDPASMVGNYPLFQPRAL